MLLDKPNVVLVVSLTTVTPAPEGSVEVSGMITVAVTDEVSAMVALLAVAEAVETKAEVPFVGKALDVLAVS